MRIRSFSAAALLAFAFVAAAPASAWAEDATLTWSFRNNHPNTVQLEFYSQHRDAAWPGGGRAWVLDDYDSHTFRLNCWDGEKICYGAWVDGNASEYWGVGINDSESCDNCCVTCQNAHAGTLNLNP
jgi:hypothetical protein